nr:immunoglobulin heavy chain junction region [Macaca mulatta]MOW49743.1 immunoglobulin heavy chain junction region [Macaca mulatta]
CARVKGFYINYFDYW